MLACAYLMWNCRCVLNRRITCRNCSNFYILLPRYESPMTGPGAHLRRLDCLNIKNVSHAKKSFSADAIQTKGHTLNMVGVYSNTASAIEAVRKKVTQLPWAHLRGRFGKLIFHMVLYILKCTCFSGDILINYCSPLY